MDNHRIKAKASLKISAKRLKFSLRIRDEIKAAREQGDEDKASRLQSHLAWHNNQGKP